MIGVCRAGLVIFQTLSDTYAAALAGVSDTPGKAVSTVRAYASLIANELNDTSQASVEEIELYQVRRMCCSSWRVWKTTTHFEAQRRRTCASLYGVCQCSEVDFRGKCFWLSFDTTPRTPHA